MPLPYARADFLGHSVGPTLGAILAVVIYIALKWSRYWRLNPGQVRPPIPSLSPHPLTRVRGRQDSDEPVDSPSLGRIGSRDEPSLAASPRQKGSSLGLEPGPADGGIHSRLDAEKGHPTTEPALGTGPRTSNVNGTTTGRTSADHMV